MKKRTDSAKKRPSTTKHAKMASESDMGGQSNVDQGNVRVLNTTKRKKLISSVSGTREGVARSAPTEER